MKVGRGQYKKPFLLWSVVVVVLVGIVSFSSAKLIQRLKGEKIIPWSLCCVGDSFYFIGEKQGEKAENEIYSFSYDKRKIKPVKLEVQSDVTHWEKLEKCEDTLCAVGQTAAGIYQIVMIDELGQVEKTITIPADFLTDSSGGIRAIQKDDDKNYYFRTYGDYATFSINEEGQGMQVIREDSEDFLFESMTVCDGEVYALFCKVKAIGEGYKLIKYHDGKAEEIYDGELLPYDDLYGVAGNSEEYDLLFKGNAGIYGYNLGNEKAEWLRTLPLEDYQFTRSCFSDKGILFCFAMKMEKEKNQIETVDFFAVSENMYYKSSY